MKQETNNEMDRLLRRLGRQDESASNGDGQIDHLDADELNAFAENALPAAARARYTEHLAECVRCRDLVVSLSGAAGVVVARETAPAVELSGFRKFLAGLFSPMMLHYGAPVLGLIGLAVVGLVLLTRPEETNTDFVVQVPRQESSPAPASQPQPSAEMRYSLESETSSAKPTPQSKSGEQPVTVPNAPPSVNVTAEVRQDAAKSVPAQPAPSETPAAAPKPQEAADETKKKAESEVRKETSTDRVTVTANEPPPATTEKTAEKTEITRRQVTVSAPEAQRNRTFGALTSAGAARPAGAQKDGEDDKDASNYAETRSVAGRRFRKDRGIWIDTAYEAPRNAMTVPRDSEQFRALIADEPAIKTIADQLDGEIIVVWKGRVYRIK